MNIRDKDVEKLAELSRIKIDDDEKRGLRKDLGRILEYFEELKEVDTKGVEPMTGGVFHENTHRHDDESLKADAKKEKLVGAFPEREGDFLKVPPVFE